MAATVVEIEFLYFNGCPGHQTAWTLLQEALRETRLRASVRRIHIRDHEEAARHRFLGSPTLRINGADVEPEARTRTDYAMQCRLYRHSGTTAPSPSKKRILIALQEAVS